MRVTRQNKRGCSRKHNDRNFDTEKALHLNPNPPRENIYENIYKDNSLTFEEAELRFYKEHFQHLLDERNQKCIDRREMKRIWTMEQFISAKRYAPENTIFQVGNKDEHIGGDFVPVYDWVNGAIEHSIKEKYGRLPYVILDSAIHYDERTPHVHERKVWIYHDEKGRECIGQEKALEEIGVPLPDPNAPVSRTNNRKMVFDAEVLAITQEAVQHLGFDIETEPVPERRTRKKDRELEEYIRDKNEELIEANKRLERENKRLEREIEMSAEKTREAEARAEIAEENRQQSEQRAQEAEMRYQRVSKKAEQAEIIISTAESLAGKWEQATFLDKSAKKRMVKQQTREEHNLQTPFEDFDR